MLQFMRCLSAEFKKRRRSLFLLLHLIIPLALSGALVTYILARNDTMSAESAYAIFFELVGVGTPVIIAVICGTVADSENEAGNFQNMIGVLKSKIVTFISQTSMMLICYCLAVLLTISTYVLALKYVVSIEGIQYTSYLFTGLIFCLSVAFQYFFYQIIGYKYGIGMCSIGGFSGLIIAALSLTTLADKIWMFLPWSWPNRFSKYMIGHHNLNQLSASGDSHEFLLKAVIIAFIMTLIIILVSIFMFYNWAGRKTNE